MSRKGNVKTIPVSEKHHKYIKKIAEVRKQSIYVVLEEFIEKMIVELFDEQNKI